MKAIVRGESDSRGRCMSGDSRISGVTCTGKMVV